MGIRSESEVRNLKIQPVFGVVKREHTSPPRREYWCIGNLVYLPEYAEG